MKTENSNKNTLDSLRRQINSADDALISAFLERMDIARAIGRYKLENGVPVTDAGREKAVIARVSEKAGDRGEYAAELYEKLMELSRRCQCSLTEAPEDGGRIYGLIGRRLGHSWSRDLHKRLGCPEYRLYELEPEQLKAFLSQENIGGLNVTIPYKRDALKLCGALSDTAREIGSVNTVTVRGGVLYGDNTDIYGFDYMARRAGIDFEGKKAVILGSGGASLAAQYYARTRGAAEITVVSRSGEDNYENLAVRHAGAQIIVNATPVGMYPDADAAPVDLENFPECAGVLDMIYNPYRTRLIMQAERLGIRRGGGLPMLAAQAAQAERVFGRDVPDSSIEELIRGAGKQRLNIVLIGMPGCGKTTVGAELALISGREVIDTDAEIEKREGMSIPEIFALRGEAYFRGREREAIRDAGAMNGVIITTGGGAVLSEDNYAPLHSNGFICHIERPLGELARGGRPLSQGADLRRMYAERLPRYEHFRDATVAGGRPGGAAETAGDIWRLFCASCRM